MTEYVKACIQRRWADLTHHLVNPVRNTDTPSGKYPGDPRERYGARHSIFRPNHFPFRPKPVSSEMNSTSYCRNRADCREIVVLWNDQTAGALHGFGDKCSDCLGAFLKDCLFQFGRSGTALAQRRIG